MEFFSPTSKPIFLDVRLQSVLVDVTQILIVARSGGTFVKMDTAWTNAHQKEIVQLKRGATEQFVQGANVITWKLGVIPMMTVVMEGTVTKRGVSNPNVQVTNSVKN